jgi:hypothetical protein
MAPEDAQRGIAEKQVLIDRQNKEIQAAQAQIRRITPMIPGQAKADTIADLPREKHFKFLLGHKSANEYLMV